MNDRKWQRSSLRRVAEQLAAVGYRISQTTLRRLLADMKYSLKANEKRLAGSSHPDRERQFEYLASQKRSFEASGMPIIRVDTKKKELIGNFKNPGQTWRQTADAVNDHDFEQDALGKATPYGIYDLKHNRGYYAAQPTRIDRTSLVGQYHLDARRQTVGAVTLWEERYVQQDRGHNQRAQLIVRAL